MSGDLVIRASGVGKVYNIGASGVVRYGSLRDSLAVSIRQAGASFFSLRSPEPSKDRARQFWSLRDVSFDVRRGEVLGIIGRNGAGKSTLLKILSRITEPTTGQIEITGRLSSLLEVGTGFHPELTGRENIYLNGSILGMSRVEIERVFEAIVDFAEVGDFLDVPVKRYSSGMYVRLAFAVAAHLDPDILILDEVLAVGDAAFQRKCAMKIDEIARMKNRTIILVSHGMGTITSMCDRVMLLDHGQIIQIGSPSAVVERYLASDSSTTASVQYFDRPVGDDLAALICGSVENCAGEAVGTIDICDPFKVKIVYRLKVALPRAPVVNFHFRNSLGQIAFISSGKNDEATRPGIYDATCMIPGHLLNNDNYSVDLALTHIDKAGVHTSFYERGALNFIVTETIAALEAERKGYGGPIPGAVRPRLEWRIDRRSE